jgi:hypothetical protein
VLKKAVSGRAAKTFRAVRVSLSSAAIDIFPMLILIFMAQPFFGTSLAWYSYENVDSQVLSDLFERVSIFPVSVLDSLVSQGS